MSIRKTLDQFIQESRKVHGNKYGYSKVYYKNNHTKVEIICPKHGVFWQSPNSHVLQKQGCPVCECVLNSLVLRKTREQFIADSNKVHGNKYDYSRIDYKNNHTKVEIICKDHGAFTQKPCNHLSGQGCPICGIIKFSNSQTMNFEEFLKRARSIHCDKYEYADENYTNLSGQIKVHCMKHGWFFQSAHNHLLGQGCPQCGIERRANLSRNNVEEFINRSIAIHGDRYDYSLVDYINSAKKVNIICKKHGVFRQTPNSHTHGQGCPKCKNIVSNWERRLFEYTKSVCSDAIGSYRGWFAKHPKKEIDIFIPSLNIGFECNGVFWHKTRHNYDCLDKVEEAGKHGISLYVIWDNLSLEDNKIFIANIIKQHQLSSLNQRTVHLT